MTKLPNMNRYVAHRTFDNGADCDGRAQRRCRRCGGVQYDWGAAGSNRRNLPYVVHWYCNGRGACGLSEYERMSVKRFTELRCDKPPQAVRSPGAPWASAHIERTWFA
jgi:hypothetical protein